MRSDPVDMDQFDGLFVKFTVKGLDRGCDL